MGRFIVRFDVENVPHYLEWSTIVDAPVTWGMPVHEFIDHYQAEYGREGMRGLSARLKRADSESCSSGYGGYDREDLIDVNRAGLDETRLSLAQIVDYYVKRRGKGDQPQGGMEESECLVGIYGPRDPSDLLED